jgi:hypothetical protein
MLAALLSFPATAVADDPDALYRNRESLADARRAAALWQQRVAAQPGDFEAAWKLARAGYWLGGHEANKEAREQAYESGMTAARAAMMAQPSKPEGYFWLAANMGGLAELKGRRAGLRYRTPIRENLEKALAIDPAFQKGSADRALGRWYYKVPGLFGGSNRKSEQHLLKALTYDPDSIVSRLFLAETYEDMSRTADAVKLLEEIEALPVDPDWAPEDTEFKAQARRMLKELETN